MCLYVSCVFVWKLGFDISLQIKTCIINNVKKLLCNLMSCVVCAYLYVGMYVCIICLFVGVCVCLHNFPICVCVCVWVLWGFTVLVVIQLHVMIIYSKRYANIFVVYHMPKLVQNKQINIGTWRQFMYTGIGH